MWAYMRERKNKKEVDRGIILWYDGHINWTIGRKKMKLNDFAKTVRKVPRKEALPIIAEASGKSFTEEELNIVSMLLTNEALTKIWEIRFDEEVQVVD